MKVYHPPFCANVISACIWSVNSEWPQNHCFYLFHMCLSRHPSGRLHCCDHMCSFFQASTRSGNILHFIHLIISYCVDWAPKQLQQQATNRNHSIRRRVSREISGSDFYRGRCLLKLYGIPANKDGGRPRVEWPLMLRHSARTQHSLVEQPIKGHPEHLTVAWSVPPSLFPSVPSCKTYGGTGLQLLQLSLPHS